MMKWMTALVACTALAGAARADDAAGKAVYDKSCASCHGADGRGNAAKAGVLKIDVKLLDLGRDEAKAMTRDDKRKIVAEGKGKMPAYGKKLSAGDLDAALDHATALVAGAASAPPPAASPPPAATPPAAAPPAASPPAAAIDEKKAKALWKSKCASCHGADGAGKAAKAKALKLDPGTLDLGRDAVAGMSRDDKATIIASGKGKMPGYAKKLKPAELDALTDYSVKLAEAIKAKKK